MVTAMYRLFHSGKLDFKGPLIRGHAELIILKPRRVECIFRRKGSKQLKEHTIVVSAPRSLDNTQ